MDDLYEWARPRGDLRGQIILCIFQHSSLIYHIELISIFPTER